jgi:hypothetical protein
MRVRPSPGIVCRPSLHPLAWPPWALPVSATAEILRTPGGSIFDTPASHFLSHLTIKMVFRVPDGRALAVGRLWQDSAGLSWKGEGLRFCMELPDAQASTTGVREGAGAVRPKAPALIL